MTSKYQQGKIYQVTNDVNDIVYIGSTIQQYLSSRMGFHRFGSKTKTSHFYTAIKEIGVEHFTIKLIKLFPCNSLSELETEEYAVMQHFRKNQTELYNARVNRGNVSKNGDCWTFEWSQNGKRMSKSFSMNKWGEWSAKRMAELWQRMTYPE